MSDFFPKWTNQLPLMAAVTAVVVGTSVVAGAWYYLTPKYSRVGYQPTQPVAFSHAIHADQLGMECRYCHSSVDKSWFSNIPATATCMNCHEVVAKDSPKLERVRQSHASGKPIPWVQVHKVPDYVYFNHSVHVNRGISCVKCHGEINKMDEVRHAKSLTMGFCLECHRGPENHIRPNEFVTQLDWKGEVDGKQLVHDWNVQPGQSCSTCHR
ncbi:MAG: cytochrome C [Pedosphaera sp.]|nr:cytochrome C [Pedosphaera sp.]